MTQLEPPNEPARGLSPMSLVGIGFELVAPVVVLMWAGHGVDRWLNNERAWGMVAGAILGIVTGLYAFVRRVIASSSRAMRKGPDR